MTILSDTLSAVVPTAAVGVLGYLAAKKLGLIGDSSKDDTTGDYDPLHIQDGMRGIVDWMKANRPEPGATFDPQTGFDVTYNIFPTDQPSSLVDAINDFKRNDTSPTGVPDLFTNAPVYSSFDSYVATLKPEYFGGQAQFDEWLSGIKPQSAGRSSSGGSSNILAAAGIQTPSAPTTRRTGGSTRGTYSGEYLSAQATAMAERIVRNPLSQSHGSA